MDLAEDEAAETEILKIGQNSETCNENVLAKWRRGVTRITY